MAGGYTPGATSAPAGADAAFPGSGSNASDDSLSGVSHALGIVPVAVSSTPRKPQNFNASIGGTRPVSDRPGFDLTGGPAYHITSIDTAIQDLDKLTAGQKATVQNALAAAGYLAHTFVPGEIDTASRAAYRAAVEDAARQSRYDPKKSQLIEPVTVADVINGRIANRQAQGIPAGGVPKQVTVTSPDDIRAAVVAQAKAEYGHKADEGLVNSIINRYQAMQAQAQSSTAATVTQPPDVTNFATQQLRAGAPTEVALNDSLHAANLVMQTFGGTGG